MRQNRDWRMEDIKLPQVEILETGLHDIFLQVLANAIGTTKEEAEIIIRARN